MTCYITERDLMRLKLKAHPPSGEAIKPLTSVDPDDESNKERLSITDYWTDVTTSKIKSDISFFLNGDKGAGKSYCNMTLGFGSARHLAEKNGGHWTDYFNIDFIAIMLPEEVSDLIRLNAPLAVKDYDDVSPGYNSRAFNSKENKEQNDIVITNRTDNNIQLWSAPDQGMTDKVLRETCNYYGEAERNERAVMNGFNILRIFRAEKNKRTGERYYKQMWYENKKLVKTLLKSDYPELKALFEEYDKKRAHAANEMKKLKEERKKELEKKRAEGGESRIGRKPGAKSGVNPETVRLAHERGKIMNEFYLKGCKKKEAMKEAGITKGQYYNWLAYGFIEEDGTPIT